MKIKNVKKVKNSKKSNVKAKKNLSKVTTDEFFEQDFEDDIDTDDDTSGNNHTNGKSVENEDTDNEESDMDPMEHKKSLKKLKHTDPEFFKYLQENDKELLSFNLSDEEDDQSGDEDLKHVPKEKLEVASDESDFEAEESEVKAGGPQRVTLQLLKTWQSEIEKDNTCKTINCVVEAFHAAVETVSERDGDNKPLLYKVEGGAVFNGVIQLCVLQLPEAFKRFLKIGPESRFDAHKSKRFVKVRNVIKSYLTDLIKILQSVTSSNILTVLLKHLHQMLPYSKSFSSLTKPLLRILLKLWSTGEETVRVVAFLSILSMATSRPESVLDILLKAMYVKYVENSKFVSPNTLPGINFMRHSLAEIYLLDHDYSYNHAFLYIRQLAIHLRNAVTLKKKEHFQAVYNWQFINSLRFWTELISLSKKQSMLRSLLYPLVQITIGTIKVIPTAQYYPLRFHCVQMLVDLSRETNTFIPILPFLLEILNSYDFNKKHKAVSMKPISLICILRLSKSQLQENGCKDSILETIHQLILENSAKDSHLICFPDLYVPCIIQLKTFLKKCHVSNYTRKIKQVLDKIEENSKFIETERAKTIFDLKNMGEISHWENKMKSEGTALAKFYESWAKIHRSQKLKLLTKNDEIAEYKLPALKRSKKSIDDENAEDSDDESDLDMRLKGDDDEDEESVKPSKPKKMKKKKKQKPITDSTVNDDLPKENTDIVNDINSDDWD